MEKIYSAKDANPMNWEEMDGLVDTLISKILASGIKISVISPILRTGGIVGSILAIKMRVLPMMSVQFKHFYKPTAVDQVSSVPGILIDTQGPMHVLLCDGNTDSGSTAVKSAAAIKARYPQAKIYLATLTKVYGGPNILEGIEQIFFGRMTDENFRASEEEKIKLDLRSGITIFPWENTEDELADINAS